MANKNRKLAERLGGEVKELNVNISGNTKLRNTADTWFLIWNIPAIVTCPFATEKCKKFCYAIKSERYYPDVLPCRQNNFNETLSDGFVNNMIYTIEKKRSHYTKRNRKLIVRIHESGDFYNQGYMDKWLSIARYFEGQDNIVFMAYTKSVRYLVNREIPKNMVVRFSLWGDTKPDELELAIKVGLPIYTAYTEKRVAELEKTGQAVRCRCDDCATCGKCWDGSCHCIACVIH